MFPHQLRNFRSSDGWIRTFYQHSLPHLADLVLQDHRCDLLFYGSTNWFHQLIFGRVQKQAPPWICLRFPIPQSRSLKLVDVKTWACLKLATFVNLGLAVVVATIWIPPLALERAWHTEPSNLRDCACRVSAISYQ